MTPESPAERFVLSYRSHISRAGSDKLLNWLTTSDFFTAPASTRFHLARAGGLVEHSLHVYDRLHSLFTHEFSPTSPLSPAQEETIAICGLLHDICKVNFYKTEMRNRKNESGQWEQYPFYIVDDTLPYGHGEKSVYIISGFMRLSREEAMAVRWHMGFSDSDFKAGGYSVGNAFAKYPLALLTHIADMQATYLDESESKS